MFLGLLLRVVVLDVVVQQAGLPEGLGAARRRALEGVVVQLDGEDGRRLVLDHSVHWEGREDEDHGPNVFNTQG